MLPRHACYPKLLLSRAYLPRIRYNTKGSKFAGVAKLADAPGLGPGAARHAGSNPVPGTTIFYRLEFNSF
jgi:hypothetical protein